MPAEPTDADLADFLDDSNWQPATLAGARHKLVQWERWLTVPVLDAGRRELRAYLKEREATVAPATRKKDWQIIRAFYAWAAGPVRDGGAGLLAADPMTPVPPPHVSAKPTTRAAKPGDVAAFEDYFAEVARRRRAFEAILARRNLVAVSLMFRSGLRVGELPWLELDDLVVRANGRPALKLWPDGTKTGEPRLVPITPETERYLKRYLRLRGTAPGPLLLNRHGGRSTASSFRQAVDRAADRLGLDVSSHQFRRGFTAQYLRAGGDVLSLEIIGGWADHRMPRRYLADEEAAAALDRFDAVMAQTRPEMSRIPLRRLRAVD